MIKVTVGNTVKRETVIIDEHTTIREALEEAGVDYSIGMTNLSGTVLRYDDLDKTFADFGMTDMCFLTNVAKADNA